MISGSPDLQKLVLGVMSHSCDVPVWGILLTLLFVLCVVAFLVKAVSQCKKTMAACNRARIQADTDDLTGLWSRHAINHALKEGQFVHGKNTLRWSVVFIDIDGLKSINDGCGHLVGDCVLKIFAQSVSYSIRCSDYAGRWGGDEFIVLVSGMRSNTDLAAFCDKLQRETSQVITIDEKQIKIKASFGYALANTDGDNVRDLIRVADARMYRNKQNKCNSTEEVGH